MPSGFIWAGGGHLMPSGFIWEGGGHLMSSGFIWAGGGRGDLENYHKRSMYARQLPHYFATLQFHLLERFPNEKLAVIF